MNKVKILLSGKEYAIKTEESASYVKQLAETLNAKIDEFISQNSSVSVTSACMLVALGLLDDCMKSASDKDNLRKQIIDYVDEAARAHTEIVALKKEIQQLKEQVKSQKDPTKFAIPEKERKADEQQTRF